MRKQQIDSKSQRRRVTQSKEERCQKFQTKHHKFLEIKWLEAKPKTHWDSNSPEQINQQKLHSEMDSQKIFQQKKTSALVSRAPEHCNALWELAREC
jgi:hypothetical protein